MEQKMDNKVLYRTSSYPFPVQFLNVLKVYVKWKIICAYSKSQRVSFCFFCDAHLWCQVWRTLLQYFQRYRLFSMLQTVWRHHWSNSHNRKMSISLKRKQIIQNEKSHSAVFGKAFRISTNYFSLHVHFNGKNRIFFSKLTINWLLLNTHAASASPPLPYSNEKNFVPLWPTLESDHPPPISDHLGRLDISGGRLHAVRLYQHTIIITIIIINIYMLLAGWEVRVGKNCDRGLENAGRGRRPRAAFSSPRSQFFPIRTDPKPDSNMFIFFSCGKLAYKWLCLRNFSLSLNWLSAPSTNHSQRKTTSEWASIFNTRQKKMF